VYASKVNGKQLTFTVSGMLWKRSLVMRDEETGSLWSHIRGECMEGDLKGARLTPVASLLTDWQSWKTMHPKTTVAILHRTLDVFTREYYRDPEKFLVGIINANGQKAWELNDLVVVQAINDFFDDTPVVVSMDRSSFSATVFKRVLDEQVLQFDAYPDGRIVDRETKSTWDLQTGKAIEGEFSGRTLEQIPSMLSLTQAWESHFPNSKYYVRPVKSRNGTMSFTLMAGIVGMIFFVGLLSILRATSSK